MRRVFFHQTRWMLISVLTSRVGLFPGITAEVRLRIIITRLYFVQRGGDLWIFIFLHVCVGVMVVFSSWEDDDRGEIFWTIKRPQIKRDLPYCNRQELHIPT